MDRSVNLIHKLRKPNSIISVYSCKMKWLKVSELPPPDMEQILIRDGDDVHLGHLDKRRNKFVMDKGGEISADKKNIMWMELLKPEGR